MKIVNLNQFRALPANTLYAKYQPCCFEHLEIKEETIEHDFFTRSIIDAIECNGSEDLEDKLEDLRVNGSSVRIDLSGLSRDACYDPDQLFAVWESEDVEQLINKLCDCMHPPPRFPPFRSKYEKLIAHYGHCIGTIYKDFKPIPCPQCQEFETFPRTIDRGNIRGKYQHIISCETGEVFRNRGPLPENCLLCDGSSISRSEFPLLCDQLGNSYGFSSDDLCVLPDFRARV